MRTLPGRGHLTGRYKVLHIGLLLIRPENEDKTNQYLAVNYYKEHYIFCLGYLPKMSLHPAGAFRFLNKPASPDEAGSSGS